MYGCGKSDSPIVAEKPSNNGWDASQPAEKVEPRGLAKGNPLRQNRSRTQRRVGCEYGRL
jgi:hypothetical protein